MKVIALVGSPRKGGNTDLLTDEFLRGARDAGAEAEKVCLDDLTIRPIAEVADVARERVDVRADDDAPGLLERVLAADVVAFASPVYWQGVTGQMKCFVDRWSAYWANDSFRGRMKGKGFAVICPYADRSSDQSTWVTAPVRKWAEVLGARYVGDVCVSVFEKGAVRQMPDVLRQAYELGRHAVEQTARAE
jgi:multimeric flavodoxin WrbA